MNDTDKTVPNPDTGVMLKVIIKSIGLRHPGAVQEIETGLFYDLSRRLRNPHEDPKMRYRNGLDADVREHVLETEGAMKVVEQIGESAKAILLSYADQRRKLVVVTVACMGGRHRSVAIAEAAAAYLRADGIGVETEHKHIDFPVIEDQSFGEQP
jgi:UPF0042 nucleotide-binding protein